MKYPANSAEFLPGVDSELFVGYEDPVDESLSKMISYRVGYGGRLSDSLSSPIPKNPSYLSFHPTGLYFASYNARFPGGQIFLSSIRNGLVIHSKLYSSSEDVRSLQFSPDGRYLVGAIESGGIVLYAFVQDSSSLIYRGNFSAEFGATTFAAFSPNLTFIAASFWYSGIDGSVALFPFNQGAVGTPVRHKVGVPVMCLAVSPNGKFLATANYISPGTVTILHVDGTQFGQVETFSMNLGALEPEWISFSPDGRFLLTANSGGNGGSISQFSVRNNGSLVDSKLYLSSTKMTYGGFLLRISSNGMYVSTVNGERVAIFEFCASSSGAVDNFYELMIFSFVVSCSGSCLLCILLFMISLFLCFVYVFRDKIIFKRPFRMESKDMEMRPLLAGSNSSSGDGNGGLNQKINYGSI